MNEDILIGKYPMTAFEIADEGQKWLKIFSQILNYKNLEPNWDREGACPPDDDLIDSLLYYLRSIKNNNIGRIRTDNQIKLSLNEKTAHLLNITRIPLTLK